MNKRRFKKGEIVSATKTFNGEIITGEFLGYHLFNDEIPDTVVGIVHVPGDGVYDVDVASIRHHESEDERIRKELIFFLNEEILQCSIKEHADKLKEFVSYLEKQKEQKPTSFNDPYNSDDYEVVVEGNATILKRKEQKSVDYCSVRDEFDLDGNLKQKPAEQDSEEVFDKIDKSFRKGREVGFQEGVESVKLAEWSEEDKDNLNNIIWLCENCEKGIENVWIPSQATQIKNLIKSLRPQLKQEWSKEDENKIERLAFLVSVAEEKEMISPSEGVDLRNFIKSLRPQNNWKPTEQKTQKLGKWSKKDKKILQSLHHVMNCADAQNVVKKDGLSVADVCNFLFSIEPNWKPSEEQIDAVRYFVNKHQSEAWAATGQWKQFTALRGLLGDLLKLM